MEATVGFVVWRTGNVTYAFPDKVPTLPTIDWVGGNLILRGTVSAVDELYFLEDRWVAIGPQDVQEVLAGDLEPVRLTDRLAIRRQSRRDGAAYVRSIGDDVILLPTPTIPAYISQVSLLGNGQATLFTSQALIACAYKIQVEPVHLDLLPFAEFIERSENGLALPQRERQSRRVVDEEFLRRLGIGTAEPDF